MTSSHSNRTVRTARLNRLRLGLGTAVTSAALIAGGAVIAPSADAATARDGVARVSSIPLAVATDETAPTSTTATTLGGGASLGTMRFKVSADGTVRTVA